MKVVPFLIFSLPILLSSCDELKFPVHQVPDGYEGFVVVIPTQPGFPELPTKGKYQVVKYPGDGVLITSSALKFGLGADHTIERYPASGTPVDSKLQKSGANADAFGIREGKDGFKFQYYVKAIGSDSYWRTRNKGDYGSKITDAENKLRRILGKQQNSSP